MKPYKRIFPYPVNFWCRIDFDLKANAIVLLERHTFFWWKWKKHLFPVDKTETPQYIERMMKN